ncbi:MAG: hypothetical protein ACP5H7_02580 [Minisyncoccia bacterium]
MKYLTEENLEYVKKLEKDIKKEIERIKENRKKMNSDELNILIMKLSKEAEKIEKERMNVYEEYDDFFNKFNNKFKDIDKLPEEQQKEMKKLYESEVKNILTPIWKLFNDIENTLSETLFIIRDTKRKILKKKYKV